MVCLLFARRVQWAPRSRSLPRAGSGIGGAVRRAVINTLARPAATPAATPGDAWITHSPRGTFPCCSSRAAHRLAVYAANECILMSLFCRIFVNILKFYRDSFLLPNHKIMTKVCLLMHMEWQKTAHEPVTTSRGLRFGRGQHRGQHSQIVVDLRHVGPVLQGHPEGVLRLRQPPPRAEHRAQVAVGWKGNQAIERKKNKNCVHATPP